MKGNIKTDMISSEIMSVFILYMKLCIEDNEFVDNRPLLTSARFIV